MSNSATLKGIRRLLTPSVVVTLYYMVKYRAKVSPKAEVDLTPNLTFGIGCVVGSFTKIKATDGLLTVGNRGGFATCCFVSSGEGGIEIGDNFICGPNVNIIGMNYSYHEKGVHLEDQGFTSKGIKIGNNVWIGAGCTILDGSVIGDNTVIVPNTLVNRRYKGDAILQGAPAKVLMKR